VPRRCGCVDKALNDNYLKLCSLPDVPQESCKFRSSKTICRLSSGPAARGPPLFKPASDFTGTLTGEQVSILEPQILKPRISIQVILRPSSKGPTHLSLTIKFYHDVYAHIDIEEGGKDKGDPTSFLKLGSSLRIGDEMFEDLDEVSLVASPGELRVAMLVILC
jgi:hypothetical protein